jgi:hypothetical protein
MHRFEWRRTGLCPPVTLTFLNYNTSSLILPYEELEINPTSWDLCMIWKCAKSWMQNPKIMFRISSNHSITIKQPFLYNPWQMLLWPTIVLDPWHFSLLLPLIHGFCCCLLRWLLYFTSRAPSHFVSWWTGQYIFAYLSKLLFRDAARFEQTMNSRSISWQRCASCTRPWPSARRDRTFGWGWCLDSWWC